VEVVVDANTWGGIPGGVCMKCQKSISLVNKRNLTPWNWASKQMMSCSKKMSTGSDVYMYILHLGFHFTTLSLLSNVVFPSHCLV
jgi:hypothetical protein